MFKINFVQNISICFFLSFLQVFGILEPKKGWTLSLLQTSIIIGLYWLNISFNIKAANPEMAILATHITIFPSFVAAFLGSFIKRL